MREFAPILLLNAVHEMTVLLRTLKHGGLRWRHLIRAAAGTTQLDHTMCHYVGWRCAVSMRADQHGCGTGVLIAQVTRPTRQLPSRLICF